MVNRRCAQDFEQRTGSMRLQTTFCSGDEPVSPPQTVFRRPVSDARTPRNAVRGFEHVPEACPEPVEWGCDAVPAPTAALRKPIAGLRKAVAALRWEIAV